MHQTVEAVTRGAGLGAVNRGDSKSVGLMSNKRPSVTGVLTNRVGRAEITCEGKCILSKEKSTRTNDFKGYYPPCVPQMDKR